MMTKLPPRLYYRIAEENNKIVERKSFFKPNGMCKFSAELKYKFGDIIYYYIFDTDHRVKREKFAAWSQLQLNKVEKQFYAHVEYLRLNALLSGDAAWHESLMDEPVLGSFEAYVLE